jgi:hypothetical protein
MVQQEEFLILLIWMMGCVDVLTFVSEIKWTKLNYVEASTSGNKFEITYIEHYPT